MTTEEARMVQRIKMVKAMEYIARQINDESVLCGWLMLGVADEDIPYGDLDVPENMEEDEAYWYAKEDDTFKELMETFLRKMVQAAQDGGLYCGGVTADINKEDDEE